MVAMVMRQARWTGALVAECPECGSVCAYWDDDDLDDDGNLPCDVCATGDEGSYWDGEAWVCEDCYFAHHYGCRKVDGRWFAGDSDTPADREPLARLADCELADNTNSETGEGIDTFSWSSCDGCGSSLGGSRFRLVYRAERA